VVPIENASMEGRTVVQWDKDDCEDLGLVKIDFLGLGMMAVLQDTLALGRPRGGPAELHEIPQDDAATYDAMCRADTVGVFQIESRAQMATLPRLQPRCFYDVAMQVSIVRPGPIVGKLVHPLIRRRQGLEPVSYLDPSVDELVRPTLQRTHGVILFQEQMLKIAMDLGNFTGAEAEELRRALGFTRNKDRLQKALEKLSAALRAKGCNETVVAKVVESCSSFAAYGFPESHALSFALLAYASTWLKVHRPAEFFASLLNNQPMGFYSPATLIQDARRHGVVFKPVCVQRSDWPCAVEDARTVRLGLRQIKGLREAAARAMLAARGQGAGETGRGGFRSLEDFLARTSFSAAERRALAAVGALNALAGHRRAALWQIEAAWSTGETLFRQSDLAFADSTASAENPRNHCHSPLPAMTVGERLTANFHGLALTVGAHPMTLVREKIPEVWRAGDLPLARDGDRVHIAGSVICRQRPGTAKGFVFLSLEDETGIANAVVRPDLFERTRLMINEEHTLRVIGRVQNQAGVIHVKAEQIEPLRFREIPAQSSHDFR
jgi:error-prone DNA polymerase